jgi:DNA-binding transcriptional ArsR family regulator
MDTFDTFKIILDPYASEILSLTSQQPMNACELSEALGIPIAACYRRIRSLKAAGMIEEICKAVSAGGKSVALYKSTLESAEVVLRDGRLMVKIRANGEDNADSVDLGEEASMLHWMSDRKESD